MMKYELLQRYKDEREILEQAKENQFDPKLYGTTSGWKALDDKINELDTLIMALESHRRSI